MNNAPKVRGYIKAICEGYQIKLYLRECGGMTKWAYRTGSHYYMAGGKKTTKRDILERHDIISERSLA